VDPVVTDANTGAMFNRYDYTMNNPYKYVDPDGRTCTVSGQPPHLEPVDSVDNDHVHVRNKWTRWQRTRRPSGGATATS
jgi:hypothetical protein